ncbi:MAG: hypothetical protein P4L46_09545 [Fimbriimonas sp.]|nr:hypothetical protein [Fimbriimonas sp.]
MKKWIGSLILAGLTSVVLAQAPFTIVRPPDGAKVRETVHVLIPKGSIPDGGYVGVFLGGKFLEAVVPPLKGKYYDYALNTKALGLPDTEPGKPLKLELVLYVDYDKSSRIVGRTSVDVNIGNQANIPIPNEGLKLRYTFIPGTKMVYRMDQQVSFSEVSSEQNSLGARPAEFTQDGETIRLAYEVMNAYGDGDGLLRIQPLPEKGKDYALLTAEGDQQQKKYMEYDMAPIYMRIKNTGQEVFGSLPLYTPLEGTSGGQSVQTDLFGTFPLPTLPTKAVRVGDDWQSQFQEGAIDMAQPYEVNTLVESFPARGEFVDTEWESGHPCAKIRHIIEAGTKTTSGKKLQDAGAQFSDDKISLQETIWFALDSHKVLKVVRDETIDRKVQSSQMGGGFPGMGGGMPGMPGSGMPGAPGAGSGSMSSADFIGPVGNMQKGRMPGTGMAGAGMRGAGAGQRFGGAGMMGPGGPGMGMGNFGMGNRNGAPNTTPTSTFIRIRSLRTFTLEQ